MLTVVYSTLLSLEIKLRATNERVENVECQQEAAERRTVTLEQSMECRSSDVEEQFRVVHWQIRVLLCDCLVVHWQIRVLLCDCLVVH